MAYKIVRNFSRYRLYYFMMVPALAYYILFHYLPIAGLFVAFKDYNTMLGPWRSPWSGFDNFKVIFGTPEFFILLRNTLLISLYRMIFNMIPDVLLALMLNEIRAMWFKRTIQTITYGPYFLSWVIVYGIAYAFLTPGSGILNQWIVGLGGQPVDLLTDSTYFRSILISTDLWKNVGFGAIIYLAALGTINPELYEAALVDGAGRFRQIRHVTLPGIASVFMLLLILRIGYILDAGFDQVYIFLNARVYDVGEIIDTWVFRRGIEQLDISVATATGLFKSVVGFTLILLTNKAIKKSGGSGIW